jgi:ParB-like chromosome segregation protein Spo0J
MDYIIPELRQHAVELDKLKLDPANANTHPEKNLRAIMDSLSAFGQRQVVLARKGTGVVIAGNGRLMAARALGWTHIACAFVDDDDITAVRYAIADNRTSELSEWDNDVLSMLLGTIKEDLGTLDGTGFDDGDLKMLLASVSQNEVYPETSAKEIDVDEFEMDCKCPRCGFEFDP